MESIVVENIWSNPKRDAHFLDWCNISLQLRNTSGEKVRIEKVECLFCTEEDEIPFAPYIEKPQELAPKQRSVEPISIGFKANLSLKAYTNSYKIRISYRQNNELRTKDFDPRKYIILHPRGDNERFFFISHKDPEDSAIARRLKDYLRKLGYDGYIAEDDPNPGVELWEEKIPPKIKNKSCIGTLVLWTSNAQGKPEKIIREIELTESGEKRVIIVKEQDVNLPDYFPKTREHFPVNNPVSNSRLIELVYSLDKMDTEGCFLTCPSLEKR